LRKDLGVAGYADCRGHQEDSGRPDCFRRHQ
jgi:hypothetical protein